MQAPNNPARAGEKWNPDRIADQLAIINDLRVIITLSGGWAWHFLSPPHEEFKVLHDHSDVDLFVWTLDANDLRAQVEYRGFRRVKTKYDNQKFARFTKFQERGKVVLDAFIGSPPYVMAQGFKVVEPSHLLKLYDTTHQSDGCRAVKAARTLLQDEEGVLGHPSLIAV